MSFYPPKISEKFCAPENVGEAANANAVGTSATFVCGAVLRFTLRIERQTKEILEAKFKTSGCGYVVAAAETLARKITGKHLTDLHSRGEQLLSPAVKFREFSESRKHCFELALEALQSAFADFRRLQVEEFIGERALICTCFGVSEETIERIIAENRAETVEQIGEICNAGTGCGSCQFLIAELLDSAKFHEFNGQ